MSSSAPCESPFVCAFPSPAKYKVGERWSCPECGTVYRKSRRGSWEIAPTRMARVWMGVCIVGVVLAAIGLLATFFPHYSIVGMTVVVLGSSLVVLGLTFLQRGWIKLRQ